MTTPGGPPRRGRRGDLIRDLQRDLRPVASPSLPGLLWRWRWEVAIFLGLPSVVTFLIFRHEWPVVLAGIGMLATALAVPDARRWLAGHARCVITAHRVGTGCAQAYILTRPGRLPVILLTSPRPFGERVLIWCLAGICLEDFQAATDVLRLAGRGDA
jgi:hypothetical protein